MSLLTFALISAALAGEVKTLSATSSIDSLKSASSFVELATVSTGKTTAKVECKLADAKLGCRTVKKTGTQAVRVTSIDAKAGVVSLALESGPVNLEVKGDLAGIRPDPWAE